MKRKLLFFMLATIPAVTFATIIGEDITRTTVLVQPEDLGTAAYSNATDFATAAQGALAVSAVQPKDLGTAAYSNATDFATAAQGAKADAALPKDGSEPMVGDLDVDGYDITDARVVNAEVISMDEGRMLIGGKTILNIAGTTQRSLIATNSFLYIAGGVKSAQWATNDYVVVLSESLATNFYKINSIDQCTVAGEPVSTLGVGDYYLTCDFPGGDVPEEAALTACGVVALKFRADYTYRGFTVNYQAGFGWSSAGEYCDIGVGRIRNGTVQGELKSLYSYYVKNKLLFGTDDGYYTKIIFYSILSGGEGFDVSINYTTSYSGPSNYNPTVSVFPNH